MKHLHFLAIGIVFGIVLFKSQAVSWYRIFEMFHFDSFHMYGIVGSAAIMGIFWVKLIKRVEMKDITGNPIEFSSKNMSIPRYLFGGILFGLGWALIGACPGPIYVLIGTGAWSILIVLAAAILGTLLYGLLRNILPH